MSVHSGCVPHSFGDAVLLTVAALLFDGWKFASARPAVWAVVPLGLWTFGVVVYRRYVSGVVARANDT